MINYSTNWLQLLTSIKLVNMHQNSFIDLTKNLNFKTIKQVNIYRKAYMGSPLMQLNFTLNDAEMSM